MQLRQANVDFEKGWCHNLFMLFEQVKRTIARHGMLSRGETVLVAVSGGVDSVVLLEVLYRLAQELSLTLIIGHLDHTLRGEEAREDARFVASLGARYGLPVIQERIDVRKVSRQRGLGLEEAGRFVRREFLETAAMRVSAAHIATGHTLDDRAETLLFNLSRGAGPTGLVGIRPVSPPFIRPLIDTSRAEILTFARLNGLSWREDRTNQDIAFSRNRIRHQIIPLLKHMNPRVLEALQRTADLLLEEGKALEVLLDRPWVMILAGEEAGTVRLYRDRLTRLPRELQGLLLRRAIGRVRGELQDVEKAHVDALCRLVDVSRGHGEAHLPGLIAQVQGNELLLKTRREPSIVPYKIPLELGRTGLPHLGITLELSVTLWNGAGETSFKQGKTIEVADADRICFPVYVRSRRKGDRFRPLGMGCEKRLKDLLIDEHVPYYERDRLALLCDQNQIVWVVGVRLSDAVRVTPKTKRVLVMQVEKEI